MNMLDIIPDRFNKFGFVIFPEQMKIYENLYNRLTNKNILEVGCGVGTGSAILALRNNVLGTDKSYKNVRLSQALYPFLKFDPYDITKCSYIPKYDIVIAIEVIEHIKEYEKAIKNLIGSANKELYISTPNLNNSMLCKNRPINNFHVREFHPYQLLSMFSKYVEKIELLSFINFEVVDETTQITPLVYHLEK